MVALDIFKKVGAIITDTHVVYASGKHGNAYINKDAVYPYTKEISGLCKLLAEKYKAEGVEIVAGPTVGGVILSQWVAHYLGSRTLVRQICGRLPPLLLGGLRRKSASPQNSDILAVFAEEAISASGEKARIFKRGYDKLIPGKKVLVVEDILTTGGSVKLVIDAVRALGGNVVGCGALVNRGDVQDNDVGAKITALLNIKLDAWDEKDCPLCKNGVPVNTDVGKGIKKPSLVVSR